jgi:ATP-dependent Lon protease
MRVLGEASPARLPVLFLSDLVLFPGNRLSVFVGSPAGIAAVDAAVAGARSLIVLEPEFEPTAGPRVGVIASITQCASENGTRKVELWGRRRVLCNAELDGGAAFYSPIHEAASSKHELDSLGRLIADRWSDLAGLRKLEPAPPLKTPDLLDWIAARLSIGCHEGWELLRCVHSTERGKLLLGLLENELEAARVDEQFLREASQHLRQVSRQEVLRKHLQWLEGELSDGEDAPLRERLAEAPLPPEVRRSCRTALQSLHGNFEQALAARTYLEFVARFPWEERTNVPVEPDWALFAETVWGGSQVRERMADLCFHSDNRMPICFAGPPGVGKGFMARRIAECVGLPFAVISLGGVRGDAVLRGTPPGSPGAAPGAIVKALCQAGSRDAVILLDDVDKVDDPDGSVWAALLELLDGSGRGGFVDRYLGHQVDLRRTWFVVTVNDPGQLPSALRDRLAVVWLRGYDDHEKREILIRRLWPEAASTVGRQGAALSAGAVELLLASTSDEVGVRELERSVAILARRWARTVPASVKKVDGRAARAALDAKISRLPADAPGRVFGLAWTPVGGTVMPIEVALLPGNGGVRITGRVGEVMGESIQAAYSWLRINAELLGIPEEVAGRGMHVHFPEAATPKDGASAGLTLLVGMLSALVGEVVSVRTAYTGEITVLGEVLPVGGIREKLLAALRAGIKTVFLPEGNRKDLESLSMSDRRRLDIHLVSTLEELLALLKGPAAL